MTRVRSLIAQQGAKAESWQRWQPAIVVVILLLLVAAFYVESSQASFRLGRFVTFIQGQDHGHTTYLPQSQEPAGAPIEHVQPTSEGSTLTFQPIQPTDLSLGLTLAEHAITD